MSMKGVVYTRIEWEGTKKFFGGVCAYCGGNRSGRKKNLTKDHVIPESMGGQKIRHNIIPACGCCNQEKSSEPMETWYRKQEFFDESNLHRIYWWVCGGCYTVAINKKNWKPPIDSSQVGGKLVPKLPDANTSRCIKRNTGDGFTALD